MIRERDPEFDRMERAIETLVKTVQQLTQQVSKLALTNSQQQTEIKNLRAKVNEISKRIR